MERLVDDDLKLFLSEAEENLERLENGLVSIEREGVTDELVGEMFRAAHTLKGSAGVIDYKEMVAVTHALESLFDRVRSHQMEITSEVVDAALGGVDVLRELKEAMVEEGEPPGRWREAADALSRLANLPSAAAPAPSPAGSQIANQARGITPSHELVVSFAPDVSMASVRAYQVIESVREAGGDVVESVPSEAEIEETDWSGTEVRVLAALPEEGTLRERIAALPEVAGVVLRSLGGERGETAPEATIPSAASAPLQAVKTHLRIAPDAVMPAVRVLQALLLVERLGGQVLDSTPTMAEIDGMKWSAYDAEIVFAGVAPAQLAGALGRIPELQVVESREISLKNREEAAPEAASTAPASRGGKRSAGKSVRVDVEVLDALMDLVGELVIDRNRFARLVPAVSTVDDTVGQEIGRVAQHLGRVTASLQEQIMKARMLPISTLFTKLPRMVRDVAHKAGKEIEFEVDGEGTELDRLVIEEIGDPIIHLLRNSVDHGVETPQQREAAGKPRKGTVRLSARTEEGKVVIEVSDDGAGIDPQKIRRKAVEKQVITEEQASRMESDALIHLIFAPGFSTAEKVSDISGRGVGMDIVKSNIEKLAGSIEIRSEVGRGSTFAIKIPLTLAIMRALLVRVGRETYAIPLMSVSEILINHSENLTHGKKVMRVRDRLVPIYSLGHLYDGEVASLPDEFGVIVQVNGKVIGLTVEEVLGEEEIVVKTLSPILGSPPGIAGATILGDGKVAPIVDVGGLQKLIGVS